MIHLLVDNKMACGISLEEVLSRGDKCVYASDRQLVDCEICGLVTPISGRPGHPGFEEFCRIARSWGYD